MKLTVSTQLRSFPDRIEFILNFEDPNTREIIGLRRLFPNDYFSNKEIQKRGIDDMFYEMRELVNKKLVPILDAGYGKKEESK